MACFGQGDAAGGALDEALADPRLQRGDAPADGGLSDTQFARGRAEAAAVDYREKSLGSEKLALFMLKSDLCYRNHTVLIR